jgi:hypothetical protein
VALRIEELADLDVRAGDAVRAHNAGPAELRRSRERGLHVRDLDVEGQVAVVAGRGPAHAAADPGTVGVGVALARDDPVAQRVVGVDLPAEQLGVGAAQPLSIVAHDLEVDDWLSHPRSSLRWAGAYVFGFIVSDCPEGRLSSVQSERF